MYVCMNVCMYVCMFVFQHHKKAIKITNKNRIENVNKEKNNCYKYIPLVHRWQG